MAELTPMMQQYMQIKEQNPDCILFFRLGDFYEMFAEDARLASRELDLTLTTRDKGKAEEDRTPMCGVPYHSSESYIARLVAKGYKVAICEQMEDPAKAKGLVKRDIIRLVTPGAVTESSMLDEGRNNYFACVFCEDGQWGLSFCDVSTGAFYATQAVGSEALSKVINELGRFAPSEVLLNREAAADASLMGVLGGRLRCCHEVGKPELFGPDAAQAVAERQFGAEQLERLGLVTMPHVTRSVGALLATLADAQRSDLSHIRTLSYYTSGRFMDLDLNARRNMEPTETLRAKEKRGGSWASWTKRRPPWAGGSCAAGWKSPRSLPPPSASAWARWRSWWATPWSGMSCDGSCGACPTWSGSWPGSSPARPTAGIC